MFFQYTGYFHSFCNITNFVSPNEPPYRNNENLLDDDIHIYPYLTEWFLCTMDDAVLENN